MAEPQFLGDRLLPESLMERRQNLRSNLRSRVQEIRRPIRQRREQLSPVDIVGMVESNARDLRDRIVSRTDVLARIRDRRQSNQNNTGNNSNQNNTNNSPTESAPPKPGRSRGEDVEEVL